MSMSLCGVTFLSGCLHSPLAISLGISSVLLGSPTGLLCSSMVRPSAHQLCAKNIYPRSQNIGGVDFLALPKQVGFHDFLSLQHAAQSSYVSVCSIKQCTCYVYLYNKRNKQQLTQRGRDYFFPIKQTSRPVQYLGNTFICTLFSRTDSNSPSKKYSENCSAPPVPAPQQTLQEKGICTPNTPY